MNSLPYETIVIGAGQAGLAAGYHLMRAGRRFLILEAGSEPTGSWASYYESLKLFSPARFSSLPGRAYPGDSERYPTRDETIAYLKDYAQHFALPIQFGFAVESVVRRDDGLFMVTAADGRAIQAQTLIVATGSFHEPNLPSVIGQDIYGGQVLHSMAYTEPSSFAGKRVVVVGAANSAVQIGTELSAVAKVTLAVRRPPNLIRQRWLGKDVHFWWWLFGLDTAAPSTWRGAIFKRLHAGNGPSVLDLGIYRQALKEGRPEILPMFERFTPSGVVWPDGTEERVDAVIFATGFKPNVGFLAALPTLSHSGAPVHRGGASPAVPGLYFLGLSYQRTSASATLRGVGSDAKVVIQAVQGHLARPLAQTPPPLCRAQTEEKLTAHT